MTRRTKKRAKSRRTIACPSPLDLLIDDLEANASLIAEEWVMDGTSFEQDQYTRHAAIAMRTAALHLRSLRASLHNERVARSTSRNSK